uniref:Choline transporter-like protein n=1 Tax=Sphaeramia orbicularis TaxID=375764 RepID=A0A673AEZ9_9TELE
MPILYTTWFRYVFFNLMVFGHVLLKVLHPTDSYGQFCGQKGTPNEKKPILFYFNILKCANPAILINLQCPTTQVFTACSENSNVCSVVKCFLRSGNGSQCHRTTRRCQVRLNSALILFLMRGFHVCAHTMVLSPVRGITGLVDTKELGMKVVEDYTKSWVWILIGLLISLVVSLVFILLLRFTAGLLLWVTIFTVIVMLAYGMWFCSMELSQLRHRPGSDVAIVEVGLQTDLQVYLQRQHFHNVILFFFTVIILLLQPTSMLFVLFPVLTVLSLFVDRAIGHIMSTLFYPVFTFVLLAVCISYWAVTSVYPFTSSSGEAIYKVMSPDVSCPYANSTSLSCLGSQCLFAFYGGETSYHRYLFVLQLSNLLVFLWLVNFSLALEQCTLAGAFSSYYWARRKPQDIPPCPLYSSFIRAIRYHTGSLAFGALILSVVQFVRVILEYVEQKLKGADNSLSRFILCCLKCCFWCLEKFIRYMNRNAYIMVAIYGKNFCTSARDAFFLLMRNVVRVAVLDRVTDFLLFLGKVLIAGGVGVIAFLFFTKNIPVIQEEVPRLNYYWVPLLTVVMGAYLIAHGFFSVYAMCVDTLFLCFCKLMKNTVKNLEVEHLKSVMDLKKKIRK